jgi:serine/threonine-protein kinase
MSEPSVPDLETLVGEIAGEFQERARRGETVDIEEYAHRYPHAADVLRQILPALGLVQEQSSLSVDHGTSASPVLKVLGEYRILREIGRGGMGVVYEAVQESLGRHVALKVLPFQASADPMLRKRFDRETRAAAKLHHTNIVPVFGIGEHEGVCYYAMQFIDGRPLDAVLNEIRRLRTVKGSGGPQPRSSASPITSHLARGLLTGCFKAAAHTADTVHTGRPSPPSRAPADATLVIQKEGRVAVNGDHPLIAATHRQYYQGVARIGLQVAEALAYAHAHGVIHRDIKPSNLLLDRSGNVWVADFGLAKAEGMEDLTGTGDIMGTLRYLAPERFQSGGDSRSDVYSLGVTLYELLTLRPAFDAPDQPRLIRQLTQSECPSPRLADRGIPRDLETIVLKAAARAPTSRYLSAAEMVTDLNLFLAERPITARRVSAAEHLWRWCRRNPLVASLISLVALVLVAGLIGVASQWQRAEHNFEVAERRRQTAEQNFNWAQEAVEELLTEAAANMADIPQMDPVRKQLLTKAADLHQKFLNGKADDPAVRLETARAHRRMGEIRLLLGQFPEAEQAFQSGRNLLTGADGPKTERFERDKELARVHFHLGELRERAGAYREAEEEHYAKGLEITDELLAVVPGDESVRLLAARGHVELGNLFSQANRFADAQTSYHRCLQHLDAIPRSETDQTARSLRAIARNGLASLHLSTNRLADAEKDYLECVSLRRALAKESPSRRDFRRDLAGSLANLGKVYVAMQRFPEALDTYRQTLETQLQLVKDFPHAPVYRERLADYYNSLGVAHRTKASPIGPWLPRTLVLASWLSAAGPANGLSPLALLENPLEEANQAYRRAADVQRELVAEFPHDRSYRYALALSCNNLGSVNLQRRDYRATEDSLLESITLFESLASEFPDEADYRNGLGMSFTTRAGVEQFQGRLSEAVVFHRKALEHHRAAVRANQERTAYRMQLAMGCGALATALVELGRHAEAMLLVEEFLAHAPRYGPYFYQAALVIADCVPLAEKDSELPDSERARVAHSYVERAVAHLRAWAATLPSGTTDTATRLRNESKLTSLYPYSEFQRLLSELESKPKN